MTKTDEINLLWILLVIVDVFKVLVFGVFLLLKSIVQIVLPSEEKSLKDQIILITGAGNGLGRELSHLISAEGARLICVDIDEKGNNETVSNINSSSVLHKATGFICDVSDPIKVQQLADQVEQKFSGVDIVISNAGLVYFHKITTPSNEFIKKVFDVNLLGSFWVVRSFLPLMKKRQSGHFVFMNSLSEMHCLANGSTYSSSKCGLRGLADALSEELLQDPATANIKVTSVHPYFIYTHEDFKDNWKPRIPGITTEWAAKDVVMGIKRNYREFLVPYFKYGWFINSLPRCLSREFYRYLRQLFPVDIQIPENDTFLPRMGSRNDKVSESIEKRAPAEKISNTNRP